MASTLSDYSFVNFLIAVVIAAGLAMLIFRHADKHGSRHATAWGLFTFLAALIAIPLYFLNYWLGKNPNQPRR
jgi:predicted PurR-regulated permease PerM